MLLGSTLMLVSIWGSMPRIQGAPTCDWPLAGSVSTSTGPMTKGATALTFRFEDDDARDGGVILHRLVARQDFEVGVEAEDLVAQLLVEAAHDADDDDQHRDAQRDARARKSA